MKNVIEEEIQLEQLVPGGQALGALPDGHKVFVWGGLPGETVRIRLTKLKKSYAEAVVVDILQASPERIAPRDECYLSTSPWQIMTEAAEVKYKSSLVVESFRQAGVELPRQEIAGDGNFYHYRNKMESSSIERPEIWAEAQRIIAELNANGDEARHYQSLLIRCNQVGVVSSGLFEMNQPRPIMTQLSDQILGYDYTYSPNGFFQINLPVYELALREMQPFINTTAGNAAIHKY